MKVENLVAAKQNPKIPEIFPGDTVKVSAKIVEGDKERIQVFQGNIIAIKRNGNGSSFTVRQVFQGIGVERTFPFNSPRVDKIEVIRGGKVRRAKLYYLRGLSGKAARKKLKMVEPGPRAMRMGEVEAEEPEMEAVAQEAETTTAEVTQETTAQAAVETTEEKPAAEAAAEEPEEQKPATEAPVMEQEAEATAEQSEKAEAAEETEKQAES